MAIAAPTDSRERLYRGLMRRNRVVGVLRWLVPLGGGLLCAAVVGLVLLDGLANRFGFSNIRIDRDNLVVDTPRLTSTDSSGTFYSLTAEAARVATTNSNLIDMRNASFTMKPRQGPELSASASEAQLQAADQLVSVPGMTTLRSSDGTTGTIEGAFVDLMNWTLIADGAVNLTLPDGSTIVAQGMSYDRKAGRYSFRRATVTVNFTPGEAP